MNKNKQNTEHIPQILVVDDEPEMRNILREVIQTKKCVAIEASKATEALAYMEKYRVDLVLLDIHMQGASGVDLPLSFRVLSPKIWLPKLPNRALLVLWPNHLHQHVSLTKFKRLSRSHNKQANPLL